MLSRLLLLISHISRDPRSDGGLRMHRTEKLVRTTGPSRSAVARREIVTEDICAWDLMLLKQPTNQSGGSDSLWRSKRVGFAADVFDADRTVVCTHTMIRAITIVDHLIDVTVAINHVMGRNFPRIAFLKLRQCTGQRSFRAMQDNLVDLCSHLTGRTVWAADELFDEWSCGRRRSTDWHGRLCNFCSFRRFHRYRSQCLDRYPNDIIGL